jgi:hypothetical protein
VFPDLTPDAQGRVALRPASNERHRQDHVAHSMSSARSSGATRPLVPLSSTRW